VTHVQELQIAYRPVRRAKAHGPRPLKIVRDIACGGGPGEFTVDSWDPAYDAPVGFDALEPSTADVRVDVELPPAKCDQSNHL